MAPTGTPPSLLPQPLEDELGAVNTTTASSSVDSDGRSIETSSVNEPDLLITPSSTPESQTASLDSFVVEVTPSLDFVDVETSDSEDDEDGWMGRGGDALSARAPSKRKPLKPAVFAKSPPVSESLPKETSTGPPSNPQEELGKQRVLAVPLTSGKVQVPQSAIDKKVAKGSEKS